MIFGKVENNKFIPDNPELFKSEFERFNGKMIEIKISSVGSKLKMYKFLYGVIYKTFKDEYGYSTLDEVDRDLKEKFLLEEVENKLTGEIKQVPMLKSKIGKDVLVKYVSDVLNFANAECGFNILAPEEYYDMISDQKTAEFISESNMKLKSSQINTDGAC